MIGIFGGTFDPVHLGHLRPALEIFQALRLEQVRFVPCRMPPHRHSPVASPEQRLALLQTAVRDEPAFAIDERELNRSGPSYMLDTLTSLREELGATPLCLILGSDAFAALDTWHRWHELIDLAHMVIMPRPGCPLPLQGEVADLLQRRLVSDCSVLNNSEAGYIIECPVTQMEIAATRIRAAIRAGESPHYLVPDSVWAEIKKQALYGHEAQRST